MTKVAVNKVITLKGHNDCIYTLSPSATDGRFISAGGDGMVAEWDLGGDENGQLLAEVENSVYSLCLVPGKDQLVVGHNYEGIHIIDIRERKEAGSLKLGDGAIFAMHVEENVLYVGDSHGTVTLVDLPSLTILHKVELSEKNVRTIVSNGNSLAVGYSDDHIRIFNRKDMSQTHDIYAHKKSVFSLKYSPGGEYLVSGSRDAHLKIWSVNEDYHPKESIVAHMYAINDIFYSPDGRHFATASMDKTVKIWDASAFKLLKVIDKARHGGHANSVNKLFWSSYKNRLISCSDDRTIAVWDLNFNTLP